jgi:hypothetical protein
MDMIVLRRFSGRVGRSLLMGESDDGLEEAAVNEWRSTKGPEPGSWFRGRYAVEGEMNLERG